ncbi:MAG: cupredoxin domain-containing protein [Actinomycetes bacterium]
MSITFRSRTTRVLVAIVAALALPATTAATVAQASVPASHTWTVQVGSQTPNMAVQGMRFLPGDVTIDAGDTVNWVVKSMEIHTVTFFKGGGPQTSITPFDPGNMTQLTQQGGHTYDPHKLFSSGVMTTESQFGPLPPTVPLVKSYSLTFPSAGTFTYYCWVHGLMMVGVVHVQPAGSAYPYTQAQYDEQAKIAAAGLAASGRHLRRELRSQATNHKVFTGGDNGQVSLMRFVRSTVVVHKGQSVRFVNNGLGTPHTVTFGKEPAGAALFAPSGDPTHFKGGDLNSGILVPGKTFKVTFLKAGTFHYICGLHDSMGMMGKVIVRP